MAAQNDDSLTELREAFKRLEELEASLRAPDPGSLVQRVNRALAQARNHKIEATAIAGFLALVAWGMGLVVVPYLLPNPGRTGWDLFRIYALGLLCVIAILGTLMLWRHGANSRAAHNDFRTFSQLLNTPVITKVDRLLLLAGLLERVADALTFKLAPYLMSWQDSEEAERIAANVSVLSADLAWLNEKSATSPRHTVFQQIAKSLVDNKTHTYRYLVYRKESNGGCSWSAADLSKRLKSLQRAYLDLRGEPQTAVRQRLEIRLLVASSDGLRCKRFDWIKGSTDATVLEHELASLPLPGDLVAYQGFPEESTLSKFAPEGSVVVMSRGLVDPSTSDQDRYDFLFSSKPQLDCFEAWFSKIWHSDGSGS